MLPRLVLPEMGAAGAVSAESERLMSDPGRNEQPRVKQK